VGFQLIDSLLDDILSGYYDSSRINQKTYQMLDMGGEETKLDVANFKIDNGLQPIVFSCNDEVLPASVKCTMLV
jgi:hypothetical protein